MQRFSLPALLLFVGCLAALCAGYRYFPKADVDYPIPAIRRIAGPWLPAFPCFLLYAGFSSFVLPLATIAILLKERTIVLSLGLLTVFMMTSYTVMLTGFAWPSVGSAFVYLSIVVPWFAVIEVMHRRLRMPIRMLAIAFCATSLAWVLGIVQGVGE